MGYIKDEAVKSILVGAYNKCNGGDTKTDYCDLPPRFQKISQLANVTILFPIICVLAFIIGIGTNYLSPTGKIHVLYNPIVLLILWNFFIYSCLIYEYFHASVSPKKKLTNTNQSITSSQSFPNPDRELTPNQIEFFSNGAPDNPGFIRRGLTPYFLLGFLKWINEKKIWINDKINAGNKVVQETEEGAIKYIEVVDTFMADWNNKTNHLVTAEFYRLFHIGSIVLTLGAFFGIYLQGLFVEYNAIWTSTFILSKNVISILIRTIWGPAIFISNLFGQDIISNLNIEGLVGSGGVPAAPWIHLFFLTSIIYILIPRSVLAVWETKQIRQSLNNIQLAPSPGEPLPVIEVQLANPPAEPLAVKEIIDDRVFKTNNTINKLLDYFELTPEEQRLLFSLEYSLSYNDAVNTKGILLKHRKFKWIKEWFYLITPTLSKPMVIRNSTLMKGLEEVRQSNLTVPKLGTILLEAAEFNPYYPISPDKAKKGFKAIIKKGLKYDNDNHKNQLADFCNALGFSEILLNEAHEQYKDALKEIPPSHILQKTLITIGAAILLAITGGIAAPIIGGAVGAAMGLSGVVAVNAGLALLGGGAIAAGGLGMAGGTALVIGGGAFLGGGLSSGVMLLFSHSKHLVLRELSKLETVSKCFLKTLPNASELIETVIEHIQKMQNRMDEEISHLRIKGDESKNQIKELEIGIEYCKEAIKRLIEFLKDQRI